MIVVGDFPYKVFLGTDVLKHMVLNLKNGLLHYGSQSEAVEIWDTKIRTINAFDIKAQSSQTIVCSAKDAGFISNEFGNKKLRVLHMITKPDVDGSINVVVINKGLDDIIVNAGECITSTEPYVAAKTLNQILNQDVTSNTSSSNINHISTQAGNTSSEQPASEPVQFIFGNGILEQYKKQFENLLNKYPYAFTEKLLLVGAAKNVPDVTIPLKKDAVAKSHRPRRYSPKEIEAQDKETTSMLSNQAIEDAPPTADEENWNHDIVMIAKKDGNNRVCVDFRDMNGQSLKDNFPSPRIEDLIDQLPEAKIFSKLDLTSGFWQFQVAEKDRHKLAFTTSNGRFRFRVMPMGITNAPSYFQRIITFVLHGIRTVIVFIDDIIVFSKSWEEHLITVEEVLKILVYHNLVAKPSKCMFGTHTIDLFGIIQHQMDPFHQTQNKLKPFQKCHNPRLPNKSPLSSVW